MELKEKIKKYLYPLKNIRASKGLFKFMRQKRISIGMSRLIDCSFDIHGKESHIVIGDKCVLIGLHVLIYGDNSQIIIGDEVNINASRQCPVIMTAFDGAKIVIGDNCLFSNSIELHTTDYHTILDINGMERINPAKDIIIDKHVWVGLRTVILKGVHIASDNVIGACSVVTSSVEETNTILCGNPAKTVKKGIKWNIKNLPVKEKHDSK